MPNKKPKPSAIWSVLTMRCPRCRRGPMFKDANPYKSLRLSHIFNMYDNCPVCKQKYDLEPGFWYGTGYVSYALAVAISVSSFVAWWVLLGISASDNSLFYWLGTNCALLIIVQPWMMRQSRALYIRFFVKYDPDYEETKPVEFDS